MRELPVRQLEMAAIVALSRLSAVAGFLVDIGLGLFADIPLLSGYTPFSALMMLYICVGVTGAGFACYFMAMEATSPITASLVFFFKPALAPCWPWPSCGKPFRQAWS